MASITINGITIDYYERPESPRESFSSEFQVTRIFDVLWDYRWLFCARMLGYPSLKTSQYLDDSGLLLNGPKFISRVTPIGYQTPNLSIEGRSDIPWMYPVAIQGIEPLGKAIGTDANGVAKYDLARITLGYTALTYSIRTDGKMVEDGFKKQGFLDPDESTLGRYVTKHLQPTAEYLTLPFGGLNWVQPNDLVPITGSVGRIIAATEFTLIWHQVPGVPRAAYTHQGSVNHDIFPDFNRVIDLPENVNSYGRGTLLLLAVDIKPYRWFLGQKLYDITYKFKYFQPVINNTIFNSPANYDLTTDRGNNIVNELYGHNHFLRFKPNQTSPSRYEYQMITHNAYRPKEADVTKTGQTVYPYKDFTDLFLLEDPEIFI